MLSQLKRISDDLRKNLSTQIAAKFPLRQLNTEEIQPLLQSAETPQAPTARAQHINHNDLRTMRLNPTSVKISWISTCLEAYRRENEYARYLNSDSDPSPPQRPQALLDISGQPRDPNHYLASAVTIDGQQKLTSRLSHTPGAATKIKTFREKAPTDFRISLIWAIPLPHNDDFPTQIIRYTIPTDDHDQTNTLSVIHYRKRAENAPLTSEDLRALHEALSRLKRQNIRIKIYSPEHHRDLATLNAYHTLRKLVDDAKSINDKITIPYLLNSAECHIAYRKSSSKGEQFDTLGQYALLLNTLYQDALQAHTLIDS